ncbi:Glu/Leu/Phe/Val dehydrogenase [Limibaculum sp. FT325]|uniref:Glu/Leu/Phe/Val family dehydrogenase n=1 Tax=Thermohalobaculum sediminis TaxID=2939436 RepID=UPI0020BF6E54|nr:Glu/Leu/Phe/Val dehydrogenase [Limibaculum sediminis]MCL5776826.1 Glu/Leu/Phe/Val dehydrogenase [Limibaculum sediminis]
MPETFAHADDLGPEKVIEITDPRAGLRAVLVVDNTAAGPAIGGCRMAPDVSVAECARLARAMTLKNAAASLPHGGGKSVIFADPKIPAEGKERLIRSFARAIGEVRSYIVGPDMGTDETAMAWVRDEIGRAVGLPREVGGIPLDEIGATAHGLVAAAKAAEPFSGIALKGARVAVQGYGAVGRWVAHFLGREGAVIVAVSDSRGGIAAADGLDLDRLDALKADGRSVAELGGATRLDPGEIIGAGCDILIPAARPDVIRAENAGRVRARMVLEGANIPATAEAEAALAGRGILVVPDFIANAGGVICAAVEHRGGGESEALAVIAERVGRNTAEVLDRARRDHTLPREAAFAMAAERVRRAASFRR